MHNLRGQNLLVCAMHILTGVNNASLQSRVNFGK